MTDDERRVTSIDDTKLGAPALHAQAARRKAVLERLRGLTEPHSIERAILVARLEKLLLDD
jgi:hypothetical protein